MPPKPSPSTSPLPQDENRLAYLAHALVTTELKLKGDIAPHTFFVPLLFPFINHPLGDELVFLALYYLQAFACSQNATGSASSLGKVPGSLLFIIALLKAFEWDETYLISLDIQALRGGIFRFVHSRTELAAAIDAFASPAPKSTLDKLKGALTPSSSKPKASPCIPDSVSVHHSLSTPRIKDTSPPEYEARSRLVAPSEPPEFDDVAILRTSELSVMGFSTHTVPALTYDATWSPESLKLKAYKRGEVLDGMRDDFDEAVKGAEPTSLVLKQFKEALIHHYR